MGSICCTHKNIDYVLGIPNIVLNRIENDFFLFRFSLGSVNLTVAFESHRFQHSAFYSRALSKTPNTYAFLFSVISVRYMADHAQLNK